MIMCGDTRIPRDICAGNTIPGETRRRIPVTLKKLGYLSNENSDSYHFSYFYKSFRGVGVKGAQIRNILTGGLTLSVMLKLGSC